MQLRPRKASSKVLKPKQRKYGDRNSMKKVPIQKIVEACQSDAVDIDESSLSKVRSCSIQLEKLKDISNYMTMNNSPTASDTLSENKKHKSIEINFKISSRRIVSQNEARIKNRYDDFNEEQLLVDFDHKHLNVESPEMLIQISPKDLEVANEVITNFSISKDQHATDMSFERIDQTLIQNNTTDSTSSLPILRKSARNRSIKNDKIDEPVRKISRENSSKKVEVLTSVQRAKVIWSQLITKDFSSNVGTIVCAKMRTYWPWPAQIIRIQSSKKVRVRFFGDLRQGTVDKRQIVPYKECAVVVKCYLESIPKDLRNGYMTLLHKEYDETSRSAYLVNMNIRALYMQAVEDIALYLETNNSILRELNMIPS